MFKRSTVSILLVWAWALGMSSAPAAAETAGPGWELTARTYPTNLAPGGRGTIAIEVFDVGASASHGTVTVTDVLPPGVLAREAGELHKVRKPQAPVIRNEMWDCTGNGPGPAPGVQGATTVTCTNDPVGLPAIAGGGTSPNTAGPNLQPMVGISVEVPPGTTEGIRTGSEANHVTIVGGGAPTPARTVDPVTISAQPAKFGFTGWDAWFSNADGTLDTQAGSHPYMATFSFDLSTVVGESEELTAASEMRNIEVLLPPGFVGDPDAVPQCTRQQFDGHECPDSSQVGTVTAALASLGDLDFRLFNIVPPPGAPADFAFTIEGVDAHLISTVRSGGDYGITTHVDNNIQNGVIGAITTLWGFPEEASHDIWRGAEAGGCTTEQTEHTGDENPCLKFEDPILKPFLTLPTACSQTGEPAPEATIRATSWDTSIAPAEAHLQLHDANDVPTGFTGCESLPFAPLITIAPDTAKADTPAGLTVEVKPPVGGLQELGGLAASDIQNTTVTLPEGLVVNPGQAAGLQACSRAEAALEDLPDGQENNGPASCPNASKVGTVTIKSPLIEGASEKQFEGNVYILQSNPPELQLLVAASADGVNLKLVGTVHLNEQTGQLTTTFDGTPALPFTVFKLSFGGGAQAALDTPTQCGTYTTTADFDPWSSPFLADFLTNAAFTLTEGPDGPCPASPLPFAPSLTAGSTTDQAGGLTSFSLLLQSGDGQQRIEKLQFKAPQGLAGIISSVALCGEPQASRGECSAAAQIGHATVASGPGPYPLVIPQPGQPESPIYLTGPYAGAPFGLSIVTHVIAGPFNLGTIVTRAKIEVDPHTAQITVTTDPLPQVVAGVPTDLRLIDAVIDRPNFMFNPTSCDASAFAGTAWGTPPPGAGGPGSSASLGSHFQVGSCRQLAFAPKFSVSTPGRTSRADGAALDVELSYPDAAQGTQANVASVKVDLPKQLPSRLTTLRQACPAAQFAANPAGCPAAAVVGHAIVHTAVLSVPLEGPAYFVSNGGEAFPNLIMVLQGEGVAIDLVGDTFINKQGITSSTFKSTPDVPFHSFELVLPQGPYSALAANGNLCTAKLTMPTEFVGQNGAAVHRSTPISVTGCPRKKAPTRGQKLATALRKCHKQPRGSSKRATCERLARRKYGPPGKKKRK